MFENPPSPPPPPPTHTTYYTQSSELKGRLCIAFSVMIPLAVSFMSNRRGTRGLCVTLLSFVMLVSTLTHFFPPPLTHTHTHTDPRSAPLSDPTVAEEQTHPATIHTNLLHQSYHLVIKRRGPVHCQPNPLYRQLPSLFSLLLLPLLHQVCEECEYTITQGSN